MVDNFVLALTHGLMLLAAWRLLSRPDLEDDSVPPPEAGASGRASGWAALRKGSDAPRA
jgi:hypothetical protein